MVTDFELRLNATATSTPDISLMNKIPASVDIDLNQPLSQKTLNEIEAFTAGLKSNERVKIEGQFGTKIIFIKYKESGIDQALRQIGNLIAKLKNVEAMNSVLIHNKLLRLNTKAEQVKTWAPEIKKIHAHISKKFHASEKISLSSSNFQSLIDPLTKKLSIPVFETLQDPPITQALKNLDFQFKKNPALSPEVAFLAETGEKLSDVADEVQAFFKFAKDQANKKAATDPNRKAVDFAKRWLALESRGQAHFMTHLFGDANFKAISMAASCLVAFVTPDAPGRNL